MTSAKKLREADLYAPIRDYLTAHGYTVHGEVKHCDVAAVKGDELVLIELKTRLTLGLLAQAARRQRSSDSVYVAVPHPNRVRWSIPWKDAKHLLRRLEMGLILVDVRPRGTVVEVVFHPAYFERRKRRGMRRAILHEIAGRTADYNTGGSTRQKIMTAYRENAIQIACYLDRIGPSPPRVLRALDTGPKTQSILYDNVYGWFERAERGVYTLAASGRHALKEYAELVAHYAETLQQIQRKSA